jgi:hypothetical protein
MRDLINPEAADSISIIEPAFYVGGYIIEVFDLLI